jgi:hypothetical protein
VAHLQQRLLGVLGARVAFLDEHWSADFILLMAGSTIFESRWRDFFCQRPLLTWPTHPRHFVWHVPASRAEDPGPAPERSTMTAMPDGEVRPSSSRASHAAHPAWAAALKARVPDMTPAALQRPTRPHVIAAIGPRTLT